MQSANWKNSKSQGFEAAFAEASPDGLIRVAYGRFESKREAYRLLSFIKYSLEEEAGIWWKATNYKRYTQPLGFTGVVF